MPSTFAAASLRSPELTSVPRTGTGMRRNASTCALPTKPAPMTAATCFMALALRESNALKRSRHFTTDERRRGKQRFLPRRAESWVARNDRRLLKANLFFALEQNFADFGQFLFLCPVHFGKLQVQHIDGVNGG